VRHDHGLMGCYRSIVVRGGYSHMLPGSFFPPMAQPLRGWLAPRGGVRKAPVGHGVLDALGLAPM
jgi:hypothetical protein